jgi:autoinducer 2-degrading protein
MHVTLVHVHVKPERVDEFLAATRRNHEGSVREPGNVRFDVLQSEEDPAHVVLVEMFRDAEAAAAHKVTPHYLAWREAVADWMAAPREGRRFRLVAPRT